MIIVCQKWISRDVEPAVERGGPGADSRFGAVSPADASALEWALRLGASTSESITVVTFGPAEADKALRDAAAAGADHLVRIDGPTSTDSVVVAREIAACCGADVSYLWCGDYSLDRGTGSVPAFLAALLGLPMALGVVGVSGIEAADGHSGGSQRARAVHDSGLEVVRRLDGGRRERLRFEGRGVISVEGATAMLRRASLSRVLAARSQPIQTVTPRAASAAERVPVATPYRPRARQLPAPGGGSPLERLHALTSSGERSARGETVTLAPDAAARRILDTLTTWGYTVPTNP